MYHRGSGCWVTKEFSLTDVYVAPSMCRSVCAGFNLVNELFQQVKIMELDAQNMRDHRVRTQMEDSIMMIRGVMDAVKLAAPKVCIGSLTALFGNRDSCVKPIHYLYFLYFIYGPFCNYPCALLIQQVASPQAKQNVVKQKK